MLWGLSCAILFPSLSYGCPDLERGWSLPCSQHSGEAGAAGVVRVVSHCWYGLAQDKGPLGTAVGPAEGQPWAQRLFLRSQQCILPSGKRVLPEAGEDREQLLLPEREQQLRVLPLQG